MSLPAGYFYSRLILAKNSISKIIIILLSLGLLISSHKIFNSYSYLASSFIKNNAAPVDASSQLAKYLRKENPNNEPIYLMIYHIALWLNDAKPPLRYLTHPDNLGRPYMLKALVNENASTATELKKILDSKPLFIVKNKKEEFKNFNSFISHDENAVKLFDDVLQKDYSFVKKFGKAHVYKRN